MRKLVLITLSTLICCFAVISFADNHLLAPKSKFRLFGYELGKDGYLVIEVKQNKYLNAWMLDPRLSSLPIHISGKNGLGLQNVQLPKPDFMSDGALEGSEGLIDFSNANNLKRNLKTDKLLVLPQRYEQDGRSVFINQLISLEHVLESQQEDIVKLSFIPEISREYPYRRFQMQVTGDGDHLITLTDAKDDGEGKSLTFLLRTTFTENANMMRDQISLLDTPSFEMARSPGVILSSDGHSLLDHEGNEVFKIENTKTQSELEKEKISLNPEVKLSIDQRLHYNSAQNNLIPGWENLRYDHPPIEDTYYDHYPNYRVLEFLTKNGKKVRHLTELAYRQLTTLEPGVGNPIADWKPSQKLQVSNLGVMTYQDSPQQAILFLDVISPDNQPVSIHKHRERLQILFENGTRADYDFRTGTKFPNVTPFEAPTHKMCLFLFL